MQPASANPAEGTPVSFLQELSLEKTCHAVLQVVLTRNGDPESQRGPRTAARLGNPAGLLRVFLEQSAVSTGPGDMWVHVWQAALWGAWRASGAAGGLLPMLRSVTGSGQVLRVFSRDQIPIMASCGKSMGVSWIRSGFHPCITTPWRKTANIAASQPRLPNGIRVWRRSTEPGWWGMTLHRLMAGCRFGSPGRHPQDLFG